MSRSRNPRNRNGNARRKLREYYRHSATVCAICGRPLDWTITDHLSPDYPVIDEVIPLWAWPEDMRQRVATSVDTTQAVHRHCNATKGGSIPGQEKRDNTKAPVRVSQAY